MTNPTKSTEADGEGSKVVGASVPESVAEAIKADAKAQDRNPSYIIRNILIGHYAKPAKRLSKAGK